MDHPTPPLLAEEGGGNPTTTQVVPQIHVSAERGDEKSKTTKKVIQFVQPSAETTRMSTSPPKTTSEAAPLEAQKTTTQLSSETSAMSILRLVATGSLETALDASSTHSSGIVQISQSRATPSELQGPAEALDNLLASKISNRKSSPGERLQRSRERNRMHARKTRQRKKEHMQNLQERAEALKREQLRLRQVINEKSTANILVGLFSVGDTKRLGGAEDPEIEKLLRRPSEEIPDASKISELPALILPGQHNAKKTKASSPSSDQKGSQRQFPDDGIDYQLLGKDRAKCTPAELDQIRRERNRMHAKRTRDRKRMFMEEMEEMIKKMEDENGLLQRHLESLGGATTSSQPANHPQIVSPQITPADTPEQTACTADSTLLAVKQEEAAEKADQENPPQRQKLVSQLKSLLVAAGAFEQPKKEVASSAATAVSATDDSGSENEGQASSRAHKRRRLEVPQSITI